MNRAYIAFFLFFLLNFLAWAAVKPVMAIWINVPPPPDYNSALSGYLGDRELAYRAYGYMLQNIGDHGGETRHIDSFDYENLSAWFYLTDSLNQKSNYIPNLAAHYFGAAKERKHVKILTDYLSFAGARPAEDKWRWLVWSISRIRHITPDNVFPTRAIELAEILAETKYPDDPDWANRLSPVIYYDYGKNLKAYHALKHIMNTRWEEFSFDEQLFMVELLCNGLSNLSKQDVICVMKTSPQQLTPL